MNRRIIRASLIVLFTSLLASCGYPMSSPVVSPITSASPASNGQVPDFKHVFVIVLENREYEEVIGQNQTPYFNSLAQHYGLALNYYAVSHPSLPNYLALTGGSTYNIATDCTDCFISQPNIVDELEAAGKSWKAYIESMPSTCFIGDAPPLYKQKHNPFVYYDDIRTNPARCQKVVPFTEFSSDLAGNTLPDYTWISPNMCNDGHDCANPSSDAWLASWVPKILASPAWKDGGALFITYDEGDKTARFPGSCCKEGQGGHVATLVISPLGKPGYQSPVNYDHYSLLRTVEQAWKLPELGSTACACAPAMADFFVSQDAAQR